MVATHPQCKCFNAGHEHHKGIACTDTADANLRCTRCNDASKKDFAKQWAAGGCLPEGPNTTVVTR